MEDIGINWGVIGAYMITVIMVILSIRSNSKMNEFEKHKKKKE